MRAHTTAQITCAAPQRHAQSSPNQRDLFDLYLLHAPIWTRLRAPEPQQVRNSAKWRVFQPTEARPSWLRSRVLFFAHL